MNANHITPFKNNKNNNITHNISFEYTFWNSFGIWSIIHCLFRKWSQQYCMHKFAFLAIVWWKRETFRLVNRISVSTTNEDPIRNYRNGLYILIRIMSCFYIILLGDWKVSHAPCMAFSKEEMPCPSAK